MRECEPEGADMSVMTFIGNQLKAVLGPEHAEPALCPSLRESLNERTDTKMRERMHTVVWSIGIIFLLTLCLILTACRASVSPENPGSDTSSESITERNEQSFVPGTEQGDNTMENHVITNINGTDTVSPRDAESFDLDKKTVLLNSGYEMPIMGLGTYSLSDETCYKAVTALLEAGGRLIDTAYMYGNEAAVGRAVRDSSVPREEIFVITKIYPGSQFANPEKAIQDALDRLDIGYIDMMLLHHPGENDVKAYLTMEKFVEKGKIHSLGLSNWYTEELKSFLPQVNITPALVQNEIHPYYQENDVIPYIQSLGIVVQGWYPFGGRGYTGELLGNEVIGSIASAHGVSAAQIILRWNLQKGVVVIPGSGNPDHIRENMDLFGFELSETEMQRIGTLDRHEKHDWY